uniref:uncharacterized protein LOC100182497 isoform X1 n=1 Tax=Ciona intestinalis TaxID=7719 RepID=UPI0002B8D517|nr:uncharacterized protein LOC100182497 isoform X1 [Ciona intestinalis]|eukprot:XP_002121688.2 uncharacterized protein LOC100182497 isoform X1 [Ciona intestinalis]
MYRQCLNKLHQTVKLQPIGNALCVCNRKLTLDPQSEPAVDPITIDKRDKVTLIGLNRPGSRNAVNRDMARQLTVAFLAFEQDNSSNVAVLHGKGDHFCAGYDLKELAHSESGIDEETMNHLHNVHGAMGSKFVYSNQQRFTEGPTRLHIKKPVIAAVNGYGVAGGLELALLCDLRVFEESTIVGVFNRRFGVPLVDGGTVRLPALVGLSNALDLILTGRAIDSEEAIRIGLANRVVKDGEALSFAVELAKEISHHPQMSLRADRDSAYNAMFNSTSKKESLDYEMNHALDVVAHESIAGAKRFKDGEGRQGVAI